MHGRKTPLSLFSDYQLIRLRELNLPCGTINENVTWRHTVVLKILSVSDEISDSCCLKIPARDQKLISVTSGNISVTDLVRRIMENHVMNAKFTWPERLSDEAADELVAQAVDVNQVTPILEVMSGSDRYAY